MLGFSKSSLSIACPDTVLLSGEQPAESTILRGHATLTLKRSARVKLAIELIGQSIIEVPAEKVAEDAKTVSGHRGVTEQKEVLRKSISVEEEDELLSGDHVFQFEIEVPNRSPASVTVAHGKVAYVIRATVFGQSYMGYDLVEEKELSVVWSAGGDNVAPGIESYIHEWSDDLGDWHLDLYSPSLSVGGVLSTSIGSRARSQGCQVVALYIVLVQTSEIRLFDSTTVVYINTEEFPLSSSEHLDQASPKFWARATSGAVMCPLPSGYTVKYERTPTGAMSLHREMDDVPKNLELLRLPDHSQLQPSTNKESTSPIRVSHQIVMRVVYRNREGKGRMHTVTRPLQLGSCAALMDFVVLPTYSRNKRRASIRDGVLCVCNESMAELVSEHRVAIDQFAERCDLPQTRANEVARRPKADLSSSR